MSKALKKEKNTHLHNLEPIYNITAKDTCTGHTNAIKCYKGLKLLRQKETRQ